MDRLEVSGKYFVVSSKWLKRKFWRYPFSIKILPEFFTLTTLSEMQAFNFTRVQVKYHTSFSVEMF